MKKILYFMLLLPLASMAQIQNYIKTITQRDSANTATQQVNVTYFDGLGRPTQKIQGKMGGDGKDIITHIEYDGFGRQVREYLPYVSTNGTAQAFEANAKAATLAYYGDNLKVDETTLNPWSEKFLEASPLGRVLKQAAPGNAWVADLDPYSTNDKTVKFAQMSNSSTDAVKRYSASTNSSYVPTFTNPGSNYAAGELYKTIIKDENWKSTDNNNNTVQEFKNREGQLILKRTFNSNVAHDTYYVYDQFGNLTYVLPPLVSGTITTTTLNNLCYQYKYDGRNRLIEKKIPGKQWEFIVYDQLDRPILTGPALSPWGGTTQGWLRTIYDDYGRIAMTGWYTATVNSTTRASAATTVVNAVRGSGTNGGISTGYNPIPSQPSGFALLTINYYDDYTWPGAPTFPVPVNGKNARSKVKGLPAGSWVRVLDAQANTTGEISYTLYDYKSRPVRSRTANYLGGFTQVDTALDFDGSPTKTVTTHKRLTGSTPDITLEENFTYTAQDRLSGHTHKIDALAAQPLVGYAYNKLGQLKNKYNGSVSPFGLGSLQNIGYTYNARGWLTDINDVDNLGTDLFAFKIAYNTISGPTFDGVTGLYNGNISETYWKTATDGQKRKYSYKYDNLNRLKHAYYQKPTIPSVGSYDEDISYDKNGNITALMRNGAVDDLYADVEIDNLTYTYAPGTNRLMKVQEIGDASPQGFKDSPDNLVDDYIYDNNAVNGNGNVTSDRNKGITNIKYNHLNLPVEINFGSTNKIIYLYDAAGRKLKKTVTEVVSGNLTTVYVDYLSGFQYKGGVLQFFPTAEGYVDNTVVSGVNNYNYVYQYKDHLGNVRLSYTKDKKTGNKVIMEENHYYPFGLKHLNYNTTHAMYLAMNGEVILYPPLNATDKLVNNYKYNGKELQDELGLNMYDYGARNYDPALGRWMNIDPLASKYLSTSPYAYALDNPIYFIDIDGMQTEGESAKYATTAEVLDETTYDYGELGGVTINARRETGISWLPHLGMNIDLTSAVFGEGYMKKYEVLASTQAGRDFYKNLHKYDETERKIYVGALGIVAPNLILPALAEFGTMVLAGETLTVAVEGAEALNVVVDTEEAVVALEEGTALAKTLGVAGEEAVGITGPKVGIQIAGKIRFPDKLNQFGKVLEEVKNVKYQSFTRQLRDYSQYAQQNGFDMILHTRSSTIISAPLQQAIDAGLIIHRYIPGL
ncbi:DUF6443 domain-containing protein [Flavobacterium sp. RHBU_24]|uniref:DUF6443 domain-containing protein n=1 Tax=Flavobacterium sp. RHBU_24 TaxID=3391185 RepID=UPI003984E350